MYCLEQYIVPDLTLRSGSVTPWSGPGGPVVSRVTAAGPVRTSPRASGRGYARIIRSSSATSFSIPAETSEIELSSM
jgi:hypothetical protein